MSRSLARRERVCPGQENWAPRTADIERFRVERLHKEVATSKALSKQREYMAALRAQKDMPFRRSYYPLRTRSDILPTTGPGTRFYETSLDMQFREKLQRQERSEKAVALTAELESKGLSLSASAPGELREKSVHEIAADDAASMALTVGAKCKSGAQVVEYKGNDSYSNAMYEKRYRVKHHIARFGSQVAVCL